MPAPGAARLTVMDWRLRVLFFGPSGRNGAGLCLGAGSVSTSAVAPSTAAPAGAFCMEVSDKLHVQCHKLFRESLDRGRELCDGGVITRRGNC